MAPRPVLSEEVTMHHDVRQAGQFNEEAMRNVRLARGLRAVAATLVVGGIVLAAVDMRDAPRSAPREAIEPASEYATGMPRVSPEALPAPRADEPLLRQIDHAMEMHG